MSRCPVPEPALRCVLPFRAAPSEVRELRRAASRQLGKWGLPVRADDAELLVTELATNVLQHVGEGVSATLVLEWAGERLRLEVHDRSAVLPLLRSAGSDAVRGRGLLMVSSVAADWGVVPTAAGKAVWCEIGAGTGAVYRRVARAVTVLERYEAAAGDVLRGPAGHGAGLAESAVALIADLLHWTTAAGLVPDDVLDQAQAHYEAQTETL
ncbi:MULTISPECIES: ATP-binding protein [unclassified Streptomyces]|uniref:ATP-binding protein n=1 Tax=unclassified Streptomyces TaxID=2593676 RepID=UPI00380B6AB4